MKTSQRYCPACRSNRLADAPATDHAFWLLLSLITAGIGVIFWILAAMPGLRDWRCNTCGSLDVVEPK